MIPSAAVAASTTTATRALAADSPEPLLLLAARPSLFPRSQWCLSHHIPIPSSLQFFLVIIIITTTTTTTSASPARRPLHHRRLLPDNSSIVCRSLRKNKSPAAAVSAFSPLADNPPPPPPFTSAHRFAIFFLLPSKASLHCVAISPKWLTATMKRATPPTIPAPTTLPSTLRAATPTMNRPALASPVTKPLP